MKNFLTLRTITFSTAAFLCSCGSDKKADTPVATTTTWTDTSMQTLVTAKCAISGCHSGTQLPNYKGISEANMKADRKALTQVNNGVMPQGSSLSSSELKTFQTFYQ